MIQKLIFALTWVSFGLGAGLLPVTASADNIPVAGQNLTITFACVDGTGDVTVEQKTDASNNRYMRIACKSGASLDYLHYNDPHNATTETTITSVFMACPAPLSAVGQPDHPNNISSQFAVYCKKSAGRDSNGQPTYTSTLTYATQKSVQTRDNTATPGSGDPGATTNQSRIDASSLPQVAASQTTINTILDVFFGIIGGIAVLVVVLGGLRYVFANGEANQIAQAKNTIVYALIGLVIAMAGYSIVTFVIKNL